MKINVTRRVLVLEDDLSFQATLAAILTDEGWTVHACEIISQAEEACSGSIPFDLVMSDIWLRGQASFDFLTARVAGVCPLIVMTSNTATVLPEALQTCVRAFLHKPFSLAELRAILRQLPSGAA